MPKTGRLSVVLRKSTGVGSCHEIEWSENILSGGRHILFKVQPPRKLSGSRHIYKWIKWSKNIISGGLEGLAALLHNIA